MGRVERVRLQVKVLLAQSNQRRSHRSKPSAKTCDILVAYEVSLNSRVPT